MKVKVKQIPTEKVQQIILIKEPPRSKGRRCGLAVAEGTEGAAEAADAVADGVEAATEATEAAAEGVEAAAEGVDTAESANRNSIRITTRNRC